MRRSTLAALAIGVFAGLGARLALAQPITPGSGPRAYFSTSVRSPLGIFTMVDAGTICLGSDTDQCVTSNSLGTGVLWSGWLTATSLNSAHVDAGVVSVRGSGEVDIGIDGTDSLEVIGLGQVGGASASSASGKAYIALNTGTNAFSINTPSDITLAPAAGSQTVSANGFRTTIASGSNAFQVSTEGARIATGPDTHLSEAGTTMVATGTGGFSAVSAYRLGASNLLTDSATPPTLSGGCTSPSVTWANGTAVFQFDVGTSCTGISTITVTLPAVNTGWSCSCWNTGAATNVRQSGGTSTTAVLTNYGTSVATPADWTDGADIRCMCRGG